MKTSADLIVVGGGATGAGIALDATLRGLDVALFEQNDFAEGTSSRSTKLVHGGVRYLEATIKHLDIEQWKLVREGLRERKIFLKNAHHLAHPIELMTPLYRWYELPYVYAGLWLYDRISAQASLGRSRLLSASKALALNPAIDPKGLKGAVRYFDGAFNDARMVIALIQSAQRLGAHVHNHHTVTRLLKDADRRITGVEVHDTLRDRTARHYATVVINATGPFADTIRRMDISDAPPLIEISSGIHIVLPRRFLPSDTGVMIPKTSDGRLLFALPWQGHCLVGTTDTPATLAEHPDVSDDEIDFLLNHLSRYLALPATRKDILSVFSGLRPLIAYGAHKATSSLVRESELEVSSSGLLTVAGGKWTSYRAMAQKALDHAVALHPTLKKARPCSTFDYAVVGSRASRSSVLNELQSHPHLAPLWEHLYTHYGDQAPRILEYASSEADLRPLIDDPPITRAEIRYTLANEYVRKPLDFLVRRSAVGLIDRRKALTLLPEVVAIMSDTLQWDDATTNAMETEAKARLETSI
jgi:glycerol-3-phosphate dehydrogenase